MGRNLFDFGDEKFDEEKEEEIKKSLGSDNFDEAKNIYDKYKNYSQEELIKEFLMSSKERIKNGELSREKLEKTIDSLSPFLSSEQKDFVRGLLDKINE